MAAAPSKTGSRLRSISSSDPSWSTERNRAANRDNVPGGNAERGQFRLIGVACDMLFGQSKLGSSEARKLGSSEARKLGSSEARKLGSSEARKLGSSEARKLGLFQGQNLICQAARRHFFDLDGQVANLDH
jgi:hypothetical protein